MDGNNVADIDSLENSFSHIAYVTTPASNMANPGDPTPYNRWRWGMIGYDLDDVGGWREDAVDNYSVQVTEGPLYTQIYMKTHINAELPGGAMFSENTMRVYPFHQDYIMEHNLTYNATAHSYGGYTIPRSYYSNDWLDWMQSWNFADNYWSGQSGYLRVGYNDTACSSGNPGPCKFTIANPSWNQPVSTFQTDWMAWCDGSNEEVGIIWNGVFNDDTYSNYGASSYGDMGGFDRENYDAAELNATVYWLISNHGKDGNLTKKVSSYKLNEGNITQGSVDAGFTTISWVKTTNTTNHSRSFFGKAEQVRIETNVTSPPTNYPKVSIYLPNGTVNVSEISMINDTAGIYYYVLNLTDESPVGYWGVKIEGSSAKAFKRNSLFYVGNLWKDVWDNGTFLYNREINITEPNIVERVFEPVDIHINFTGNANENSTRVVFYNGLNYTEIPSQLYNITYSGGYISEANIVFLTTIQKGENRTYYVLWKPSSLTANYTSDINITNVTTGRYQVTNAFFNITLNSTYGGLMQEALSLQGGNSSLSGLTPIEYYPEARIQIPPTTTFTIRDFTTPTVSITEGPIFVDYLVNGSLSGNANYPYNLSMRFFANNPYYIQETNISIQEAKTWEYFYDYYLAWVDGKFTTAAWKNSTGNITTTVLASGNNNDNTNLDINLSWLSVYNTDTGDAMGDIFLERTQTSVNSPVIDLYDDTYDYYQRKIIASSSSISSGSHFYSKIARVLWYGVTNYNTIDDLEDQLNYTMSTSIGTRVAFDTTKPGYSLYNVTPTTPNDNQNVTCYSSWIDNVEMDYVIVEENLTGTFTNHTVSISSGVTGDGNYTVNGTNIQAGTYACKFHGVDTAGNLNLTDYAAVTVSDLTAPSFSNTSNNPTENSSLDPNSTITINATFLEYSTVDKVATY
ncbi:MAG: hypothetical protein ABIH25_01505, partial [Candidatus Woesearchaeota archaeon]